MDWSKQIGRYILVMALQVLLFDQLQLWGVCHPYIYILCLLMMPITLPHSVEMIIGAVVGLVMDVFCNSLGVHMSACILVMYLRPYLLERVFNEKDRLTEQISIGTLGWEAMSRYVILLVLIHHLTVFSISAWSWSHIGYIVSATVVSGAITTLIILGYNALTNR